MQASTGSTRRRFAFKLYYSDFKTRGRHYLTGKDLNYSKLIPNNRIAHCTLLTAHYQTTPHYQTAAH